MGQYVITETAGFKKRIDNDMHIIVTEILCHPQAHLFKAIVLTGGYGRGEGTPYLQNDMQQPYNDYDLVIICDELSRYERNNLQSSLHPLEAELAEELQIAVDLAVIPLNILRKGEFSLFNYEMKNGHRVLWGDPQILDAMPKYAPENLPLIEGTRLLLNRGYLLWENCHTLKGKKLLTAEEEKVIIKYLWKVHLAFGDCLLIAHKIYEIDYRKKRDLINNISKNTAIPHLDWIIKNYRLAIDFKHQGDPNLYPKDNFEPMMKETTEYFASIFLWYESCRLGVKLANINDYIDADLLMKKDPSPFWKSVALNLSLFKMGAFKPSWRWCFLHPRHRIFCSLLLLLQPQISQHQTELLCDLLHCDKNQIESAFRRLRQRLA